MQKHQRKNSTFYSFEHLLILQNLNHTPRELCHPQNAETNFTSACVHHHHSD